MAAILRHRSILSIAEAEGSVGVEDLARRLSVTVQTIRRDLTELSESGALTRIHGGAVLPEGRNTLAYGDRQALNAAGKAAIGRRAAAEIPDGAAVLLNIGTTTEAVARALLRHTGLTVVTNNLNVAHILAANPGAEVLVTGGRLRRQDGGLIGDLAADALARFKVDCAVIGTSALDAEGDLLDFDLSEVRVSRAIIAQARRTLVVADHTKLARRAPVKIASLAEVDALVTDRPLPPELATRCAGWGTAVLLAGGS